MLRVAIKGVLARKLRLLLTSIAVVLGVAFVSGAFFLTDSMRASFDDLFTQATEGIDVQIQSIEYKDLLEKQATSQPGTVSIDLARVGMPQSVIDDVEEVDGVAKVAGSIFEFGAQALDKDGKPISTGGAPAFGANWVPEAEDIGALRISKGKAPDRGDVMLDVTTMEKGTFEVGDKVTMLVQAGRVTREFTISGVVKFGTSNNLNGAAISVFETREAQQLFDMGDRFTAVQAQAEDGVSQAELKRRIDRVVPEQYDVITGAEFTQEQTEAIDSGFLNILQNVILGFAAVAVFVGAFTIFNTFTILVGQRTREIGLLRAIGAGRRQVLGIVVLEALVTGIVASTAGIVVGYGVAALLRELLNALVDAGLPTDPFPVKTRTIVAAYVVGVLVTLVASLLPAWRASRLSPLEALRANPAHAGRGWKSLVAGALLLLVGAALAVAGFTSEDSSVSSVLSLIGGGFAVAIIGIALLSRAFIVPIACVLALALGRGTTGDLATRNVLRNRARSATTASALMIGLALASLVLVFQASLTKTIDNEIDRTLGADISVYNSTIMSSGSGVVDQDDVDAISRIGGVDQVTSQAYGGTSIGGAFDTDEVTTVTSLDDVAFEDAGHVKLVVEDGEGVPGSGILVDADIADEEGWKVGDEVEFAFTTKRSRELRIEGIFTPNEFVGAPLIVSTETFNALQPPAVQAAAFVYVSVDGDEKPATVVKRIRKELGRDGAYLEIKDTEALRTTFTDSLAPILGLVFGMLSLSLIIALFGIANTLALNVFERTREIGLIRAVGGTRRQVRRMIRAEAVIVAVFGAIVGVVVGVAAGWALIGALEDEGFEFAVNPATIAIVLVLGFVAGVLAAVFPARRAARTDVLAAIATE